MPIQGEVDKEFLLIKEEWDRKVKESGKSEQMFIATDNSGYVACFLHSYKEAKETVEADGLIMPELIVGLKVTAVDTRVEELELALRDARLFANWVECLGRTDCEIYKHELKAVADKSISRITKVLGG